MPMPMRVQPCGVFWEAFAGTAAVSRCLVGAPMDLVAWLGGKRRVAKLLLRVLGLQPRQGARSLLLSDPGPWGWVWPVLLNPVSRARVVGVLRAWATGCPACSPDGSCAWCGGTGRALNASELWGWLASRPPAVDLAARTAGWLWLQARAAGRGRTGHSACAAARIGTATRLYGYMYDRGQTSNGSPAMACPASTTAATPVTRPR